MSGRLLAGLGVGALGVLFLTRGANGPPRPEGTLPISPALERSRPPAASTPEEGAAVPARDLFRYADTPAASSPVVVAPPRSRASTPLPTPLAPVIRLVGLVRRGGGVKAALFFGGEVHMLGRGDSAGGYLVLSLDEEAGVRLRGPDGSELVLSVPGS